MLLDIIIAASCGGAGVCCGWVMHACYGATSHLESSLAGLDDRYLDHDTASINGDDAGREAAAVPLPLSTDANASTTPPATEPVNKVAAVADRIRSFVSIIAANVDEHQSRVDAVSGVLSESDLSAAPPEIIDAVEKLIVANEAMRTQLAESQQKLREQTKQLQSAEQRAQTDALTQVANRGAFDERLEQQHARGSSSAGVLAIFDIDYFKRFNDEYGHRIGDEVLRSVAQMLEARLQPYGMVARFGGEEFCALINNLDYKSAIELIEQTRNAISNRELRCQGQRLKLTMSAGIGTLQPHQPADDWLQQVDDALYRSKEVGRDCSHYVDGDRFVRAGMQPDAIPPLVDSSDSLPAEVMRADGMLAARGSTNAGLKTSVEAALRRGPRRELENVATLHLDKITSGLQQMQASERPRSLAYLPDREMMIEGIIEAFANSAGSRQLAHLMSVSLSGHPSSATMRSLLQWVRAAMRSQDRIGCLDHSTLLIYLSDCDEQEVLYRAKQVCHSASAMGLSWASAEKQHAGERLAVGIATLNIDEQGDLPRPAIWSAVDDLIFQTQALALLAGRQSAGPNHAGLPILARAANLRRRNPIQAGVTQAVFDEPSLAGFRPRSAAPTAPA